MCDVQGKGAVCRRELSRGAGAGQGAREQECVVTRCGVVRGWGQCMWAVARGRRFAQMGICMARCVAKRVFADMMLDFGIEIRSCFSWGVR